jgi:hypothetical protein
MLTKEEYEAKRQARYDRYVAAAEKAQRESDANWKQASLMADFIPFGQPILIGHHSEKRDRNYRARIESKHRKGYELHQKAAEYRSRAESIQENDAIFSDDPSATEKLSDKITKLEELQAMYKTVNAAYKKFIKNPATLDACTLPEEYKAIIRSFKPEWSGDSPIPSYRLTNNNANIRRLKERAQVVERKQAMRDEDLEINGVRIEGRPSENRIRLYYGKRVDLDTFRLLKQHGFRVLRSEGEGAFSAYYNNNALYFIKTHIKAQS